MNWLNYLIKIYKSLAIISFTILIIFATFIIYLEVNQLFNITEIINEEVLEIANEKFKSGSIYEDNLPNKHTNKCIFNIFSDLFNKSSCSYKYYPSYFVKYNPTFKDNNIYLPHLIIEYISDTELLKRDLIAIITEYLSNI
jgi:hypothetical protein